MTTREQYVLTASVDLVNRWRREGRMFSQLTSSELLLWMEVDRMQDEDTVPQKTKTITG